MLINKNRNKQGIIISAAAMILGILLILAGIFGGSVMGIFYKGFDPKNITPDIVGKNIRTDILVDFDNLDLENIAVQNFGDREEVFMIALDLSALSESDRHLYYAKITQHITIDGTLRPMDDAEYNEVAESMFRHYDYIYYNKVEDGSWAGRTIEEFHDRLIHEIFPLLPYCFEVRSIGAFNWTSFIPVGVIIFVLSMIVEICFVFKLKKRIVLPVVYGLLVIVPAVLFFDQIRTMLTVKKAGDGLYTMENIECTDTDGLLGSGAATTEELMDWIFNNHLYGIRPRFEIESYGCSAFTAVTPKGEHLFGRNFDYPETDTLLVHSHPEGCYESIGAADLGVLGVGQVHPISPDSPLGRLLMGITPYLIVDGMNEEGVGAGILELAIGETHQDNGKPDLLAFCAVRAILDKCASVDEALTLLDSYDFHSDMSAAYHLFITDKSGKYVVVEWLDGKMVVTEQPCCTNSVVAPGEYFDKGTRDNRISIIKEELGQDLVVTKETAMEILDKVQSKDGITEWSCVYNLDDFTVDICLDADYGKVYSFSASELK